MASHNSPRWCPMCPSLSESEISGTADQEKPVTELVAGASWPTPYWRRLHDSAPLLLAPCLTYALAFTAGILFDHYFSPVPAWCLFAAGIGLVAWLLSCMGKRSAIQVGYLCLLLVGLGAAHHHFALTDDGPEDICRLCGERSQLSGAGHHRTRKPKFSKFRRITTQP